MTLYYLTKLTYQFRISESTSEIVSGDYGGQSSKMIYAVFTTPRNSISANAICAFRLRDLLDTFEGKEFFRKAYLKVYISNHHYGSKIKLPIHPVAPPHFAASRGHLVMLEFFACWLAERPKYLRIPTTTKQPLLSCFKMLHLLFIKSSWNLNLELTRTVMSKYIFK